MQHVEAVRRFNRFYTRRIGALSDHHLGSAFTLPEARVLYELGRNQSLSATVLGRELDLDLGYLSRLLQGLRRRGLVQAARSAQDGRQSVLSLTSKGRKAFASLDQGSRRAMGAMLAPLPKPQRVRLVGAMTAVQRLLDPAEEKIRLRAHGAGDMGWVVQRHGVLYAREYGWGALFEALVADIVAKFLQDFDAKRERCWIAEQAGEPVGSVFVVKENATTAKLRLLLIEPHARGKGLGRRLVEECVAFSRRAGYRRLVLWTHKNLTAARAIYSALGFRLVKSERHSTFGVPVTGEYWEMEL
jgi:DNA-binding MarR family transcriptional regulator/GNAT superfamily N-acetyltransferase